MTDNFDPDTAFVTERGARERERKAYDAGALTMGLTPDYLYPAYPPPRTLAVVHLDSGYAYRVGRDEHGDKTWQFRTRDKWHAMHDWPAARTVLEARRFLALWDDPYTYPEV
jgi:hypothetical protein